MDILQHHTRRFLQTGSSLNNGDSNNTGFDSLQKAQFTPTMAIILAVLLSAFFFMGFFSVYVKRCTTGEDDEAIRARTAEDPTQPLNAQPQGVDPAFLETLPLVSYVSSKKKGSNVECVVCLTEFDEGEPLCQLPRCKHVFHKECIDMWLFSHTTCPLCRRSVLSDGSLSFQWGGSGSLRLSLGRLRSRRESGRGSIAMPSFPAEGEGSLSSRDANANPNANSDRIVLPSVQSFSRSHSTGHSLVKQGQSRTWMRVGTPDHSRTDQDMEPKPGCLSVTPPAAAFRRSRSMVTVRDDMAYTPISFGAWMREARTSLRRALSFRKLNLAAGDFGTPVGAVATSSSARSTFDRLNPVVKI